MPAEETFDMDDIMDKFQEFVANPDPYMEAFGIRAKRDTENHAGFKEFPIPFIGAKFGVKYVDPAERLKGGEAFFHVDDLQSLIPRAHSRKVKLHVKFNGGASTTDGLFEAEVDYHMEHKDGHGTEEGSMKVVRQMRGGKWHTNVKTEAQPFSGTTIISQRINNMELDLESDRATMFNAKYVNPTMNRDIDVKVTRVPGKSIKAVIVRGGVTSVIEGVLSKPSSNEIDVDIDANIRGVQYTGKVSGKMEAGKSTKLKVEVKKGSEGVLQMLVEVKLAGSSGQFRGKYSIMGGKVAQGKYAGKWGPGKMELEAEPYKLSVDLQMGRSIKVKAEKSGVEMWTYKTLREDKSTGDAIVYEAKSEMTLNPTSKLHHFIDQNYAFGAWEKRSNTFKLFIDRNNRNTFLRKFKVEFDVVKDGAEVIKITGDTTGAPYNFEFLAPNLFKKMGSSLDRATVTVNHQKGKSLNIKSNIRGGLELDINHTPNSLGGRTINVLATKAGAQMFKYHGDTSKVNNAAMLKVGLKGEFDLSPESILYKTIVSKYRILTPFAKRTSELEFFWDKQNKNVLINKFYAKVKIDKDGTNVANIDISTNEKPYKLKAFLPAVFGRLRPGMTEVDVTVAHELGQFLEMKVNHAGAKFKGFKIAKTGNGEEREITWNGKKLGRGQYELTASRFQTTQTLENGKSLTTTITWKNKWDSPAFLLDNKVNVNLAGTERKLDLNMNWDMSKVPDFDMSTPESGHFKMAAVGNNKRWGDYTISRDVSFSSANKVMQLKINGDSAFAAGPMAATSPIHTVVDMKFDVDRTDLEGTFKKVMAGKVFSVIFPKGISMPSIRIGA